MNKIIPVIWVLLCSAFCLRAATFTVTNTASSGSGSFNQAISDANLSPGADNIQFNIPGGGVHTINLIADIIDDPVTIDGTSQPGYTGTPLIRITGAGLEVNANNVTIRALKIDLGSGAAIRVVSSSFCTIDSNDLQGNGNGILFFGSNNNHIVTDNNMRSTSGNSLYFTGGGANDNIITDNDFSNSGEWGLSYHGTSVSSITDNDFTGCNKGIHLIDTRDLTLSPPGSGGPNENTFMGISTQVMRLEVIRDCNVSGWDFTSIMDDITGKIPIEVIGIGPFGEARLCTFDSNNMSGALHGILFRGLNRGHTVSNNIMSSTSGNSLYFTGGGANDNIITDNDFSNSGDWGLSYHGTSVSSITDNDFTGCNKGIHLIDTRDLTLSPPGSGGPNENTFMGISTQVMRLEVIRDCNVSGWDFTSIMDDITGKIPIEVIGIGPFGEARLCTFDSNNMSGALHGILFRGLNRGHTVSNNIMSSTSGNSLYFTGGGANDNIITGNDFSNSGDWGLAYENGTPATIADNDFSGSLRGLLLFGTTAGFTLQPNTFVGNTLAIEISTSRDITVLDAETSGDGGTGIQIFQSNTILIENNTSCGRDIGIRLLNPSNNNEIRNSKIANAGTGIRIEDGSVNGTNIANITFSSNVDNIIDFGTGTTTSGITESASASFCPAAPSIPTMGEWGLIILGLSLLCLGAIVQTRKRTKEEWAEVA